MIAMISLSVIGLGLFTANHLKKSHIASLEKSMLQEIRLIDGTLSWPMDQPLSEQITFFEAETAYLKHYTGNRITFIDLDGTVLGDTHYNAWEMDNHLNRGEIMDILDDGGPGYSIRFSDTIEHNMINVAMSVERDGELIGYIRLGATLDNMETAVQQMWLTYLLGLILLLVLAAVISYLFSKSLTRPLEHITYVAQQITQANDQSRVRLTNKDEIGQLGHAINDMAVSLQLQMKRIADNEKRLMTVLENLMSGVVMINETGHIVLINKVAELILGVSVRQLNEMHYHQLKRHHIELHELVEKSMKSKARIHEEIVLHYPDERNIEMSLVPIEEYNDENWTGIVIVLHDITNIRRLERVRSEFVANVSHELKTPIASVKGFSETLLDGAVNDPETAHSFLKIIYDESERLDRLIMDLLDLSKIESKRIQLDFSPIEMEELVEKTVHSMQTEAQKKQIQFDIEVPPGLYIEADEDRLRQVFINLLSNGINYTPPGGKVSIRIDESANDRKDDSDNWAQSYIDIQITDTGIGVPKKDLPRIFERFYRVDKARSRRSGGTGLGLSIVKHIVDLHNGEMTVTSEVGVGTTFIIRLPVIQF